MTISPRPWLSGLGMHGGRRRRLARGPAYRIPDPPKIERPLLPTEAEPILWEASAEIGTGVWSLRISAFYAFGDWLPKSGREKMESMSELSIDEVAVKIRPEIVSLADVTTKEWGMIRVGESAVWTIESMIDSYRLGTFVEFVVSRRT